MARKKLSERAMEAKGTKRTFTLGIPRQLSVKKEEISTFEKTSLYVPTGNLITKANGFSKSKYSDDVLISEDLPSILKAIFKYGDVDKRYGENGLEKDVERQQIIVYTVIVCQKHLLFYQRSSPEDKKKKGRFIGDARLQGELSVGFGGHKTSDDISFSREELVFLRELLPAIQDEIGTMLGLNHGFFKEVEEEIGIERQDVKDLSLLGAFYGKWIDDPLLDIQVHWVHTGIAAIIEVDPVMNDHLTFRASEIANAWWVPLKDVEKEFEKRQKLWLAGRGTRVERWTEVMIKEFIPRYRKKFK